MATTKDKVVGEILETYDYSKFKWPKVNRGMRLNDGIDKGRKNKILALIESGEFVQEQNLVTVTPEFKGINGRHSFEALRANSMPIRYYFVTDHRFNGSSTLNFMDNVVKVNKINPTWSWKQVFDCALNQNLELALNIQKKITKHNNTFTSSEVFALVVKDARMFSGFWKKYSLKDLASKEYIETFASKDFAAEFEWFLEFNNKARASFKKSIVLSGIYSILFYAKPIIGVENCVKFRKAIISFPDDKLKSSTVMKNIGTFQEALVKHYNSQSGKKIDFRSVALAVRAKGEVKEIE